MDPLMILVYLVIFVIVVLIAIWLTNELPVGPQSKKIIKIAVIGIALVLLLLWVARSGVLTV